MNSTASNTLRNLGVVFTAVLLVAISVAIAPKAHAANLGTGDYFGGDYSYGGGDYLGGDYSYSNPVYTDYVYSDPSYYSGGGYSYGGGFTGGWSFGGGGFGGSSSSFSSVYAPTNTCTATNSCNTTTQINAPTNIVTNTSGGGSYSYPVYQPIYTQPSYPVYYAQPTYTYAYNDVCANLSGVQSVVPAGYTLQNGNCNYVPTYNTQPYVTLAAVPYTGLDLGPWGTALYWGFLVLWCLLAAYLVVVKKIQNKIAAWFVGTEPKTLEQKSEVKTFVKHNSAPLFAGIDSFILSQINRAK